MMPPTSQPPEPFREGPSASGPSPSGPSAEGAPEPGRPPRARVPGAGRPLGQPVAVAVGQAVAVAMVQVVGSTFAAHNQHGRAPLDAFGYLLLLLGPALLVLRRRRPVAVVAGTSLVTAGYLAAGYPYGPAFVSWLIACCAAIGAGHRRAAWAGLAGVYLVHVLATFVLPADWQRARPPSGSPWLPELGLLAWLLLVVAGAELVRFRRERIAAHRAYRQQLEERRANEERLKMARELHDILAHSLSLINIQAGVALALLDRRPAEARTALVTIKSTSKEALGEVRQVLATLRGPGAAPRGPAPGLDRLDELTEQADRVGLEAEVHERGDRRPLSATVDLTAFRIVQEALTNVVRHSAARQAVVVLDWTDPAVLVVRVEDPGPAVLGDAGGSGSGLVGMRERAAAFGGTITAGPLPGGGFRVRAELPTPKAESE
ncbi:histidine kinase [Streptomyces sp. 1114.5]|uniref:sensor histidine kinase n=1 Tax=unclassified Streptomyces TaxID=2593676 RepID=UPI000BD93D0A|nr:MULTISPECIES: sensor histidine kinase [unclassified Streptomyces]RKT18165.1 histidine kinase [Streptomyces sp. 1114.5]SOB84364.1 Histidine kinase [Streptomyces sp. 1331.2]